MRIESSNLSLSATSSQKTTKTVTEQLNAWVDSSNLQDEQDLLSTDPLELLDGFLKNKVAPVPENENVQGEFTFEISESDKIKIRLLREMIEALTGKKLQFFLPDKPEKTMSELTTTYNKLLSKEKTGTARAAGWGISFERRESTKETAQMSFRAQGVVKLSNGISVTVDLSLNVQRSFVSEERFSFQAGDALIDPLVVNFASASAELSDCDFSFDLDNNGREEKLTFVKSGSGFLVFDKNQDGKINNGSELFGPASGNGFAELKAYDSDGNDWIDENDPIYDRLQIWTKDEAGQDRLFAIGQMGIGAIYVKGISSLFELKDASNPLQGKIQQTSVFLRMPVGGQLDGSAGTIQHVDLSI